MLIKKADDPSEHLDALEALAKGEGADAKRAHVELRNRKAGFRAERESAYLIDHDFAASKNWAVIHDLRLEHGGRHVLRFGFAERPDPKTTQVRCVPRHQGGPAS